MAWRLCTFMAVKDRFEGIPWTEWAEDIRLRWNNALDYYRKELYFEIEFQEYMQFKFYEQWAKLKAYANKKGIRIIGDIPIYVAMDFPCAGCRQLPFCGLAAREHLALQAVPVQQVLSVELSLSTVFSIIRSKTERYHCATDMQLIIA